MLAYRCTCRSRCHLRSSSRDAQQGSGYANMERSAGLENDQTWARRRRARETVASASDMLDIARVLAGLLLLVYFPGMLLIAFGIAATSAGPVVIRRVYRR